MEIAQIIYKSDTENENENENEKQKLLNKKLGKPPSNSSKDDSSSDKDVESNSSEDDSSSDKKVEPRVGISVKEFKKKDTVISYNFNPLKYDLKNAFTNEKIPNKFNNLKAINFEVKGLEQKDGSINPDLDKNLLEYIGPLSEPLSEPLSKSSSANGGGKKNKTKKQKTTKNTKTRKKSK